MYDFVKGTTQEEKNAMATLTEQAKMGDVNAMHKLGMAHIVGCIYNPEAGITHLQAASSAGNVESTRKLAGFLYQFDEVRSNWPESLRLASSLAQRGDLPMQLLAAELHQKNTNGITQDLEKSYSMAKNAAERGYAPANTFIGDMHKDGVGVKQDTTEAMSWYQKALDAGDQSAASKISALNHSAQLPSAMESFFESKGFSAAASTHDLNASAGAQVENQTAPRMG